MKKKEAFLFSLGIVLFLLWTFWVIRGNSNTMDSQIYHIMHSLPKEWGTFFRFITRFGNTLFIFLFTIISLLFSKRYGKLISFNIALNIVLNNLIKFIIQRDRPSFFHMVDAKGFSYPSGHAMIAVALYGFLLYLCLKQEKENKWRYVIVCLCLILMIFIPISRVYLGVHFASDVLGGVWLSILYLWIYIKWIEKKRFLSK